MTAPETTLPKMRVTELATLLVAGLLLVVVSPQVLATHWTPKVALALLMIGPGLAALGLAAFGRDRGAIAGLVFVGVAAAATILSPSPMLSLVGMYNHGTGWLFVAAVVYFVPLRPGEYEFYAKGYQPRGLTGKFHVR